VGRPIFFLQTALVKNDRVSVRYIGLNQLGMTANSLVILQLPSFQGQYLTPVRYALWLKDIGIWAPKEFKLFDSLQPTNFPISPGAKVKEVLPSAQTMRGHLATPCITV
jgi:hypothetical protein